MLIEAMDIHKTFPPEEGRKQGKYILRGADLALQEGETAAVIGPSGCGKTTLALILAGLMTCDKGRVFFRGTAAWQGSRKSNAAMHRRIQLVSQHPETAFDPLWTMEKSLSEALALHHLSCTASALDSILARFQLQPFLLKRLPGQLSGGELQRFAIIRALSLKPAVLILDEPTAMLDAVTQTQITGILREFVADSGMASLLIIHDLRLAGSFCEKAWEIKEGLTVPFDLNKGKKRKYE